MSLDVYLRLPGTREPIQLLDVTDDSGEVFSANITHNLGRMASEAGVYQCCWWPEEVGVTHAKQLVAPLRAGIAAMKADPDRFKAHDSPNGWGLYRHFLPWLERYLAACEQHPDAEVRVSR